MTADDAGSRVVEAEELTPYMRGYCDGFLDAEKAAARRTARRSVPHARSITVDELCQRERERNP